MASSFAQTTIIGRLGNDAEVNYTPKGNLYVKFNAATDKWVPAGQDEKTVWYRVTLWGKLAETMANLIEQHGALAKGDPVFVQGELDAPDPFQGNDGTWRASLELTGREVRLLGSRNPNGGGGY